MYSGNLREAKAYSSSAPASMLAARELAPARSRRTRGRRARRARALERARRRSPALRGRAGVDRRRDEPHLAVAHDARCARTAAAA